MANQYFVFQAMPAVGENFELTDAAAVHHIFTVLRAKAGDSLRLVFDDGKVGRASVVKANEHLLELTEILSVETELPVAVTIAVGLPKGDKLDFIAEKATELGAAAIWAAPFDWSVSKYDAKKRAKKYEKLTKIVQNAAEQSLRQMIPEIALFENFHQLTEKFVDFDAVLIAYEETAKAGDVSSFAKNLSPISKGQKILMIFGPEGGISPAEIDAMLGLGAATIGLGPRILRAETAPLVGLSQIAAYYELFGKV